MTDKKKRRAAEPRQTVRRVHISCPDGQPINTTITDAETGEPINNVQELDFHLIAHKPSEAVISATIHTWLARLDAVVNANIVTTETPSPLEKAWDETDAVYTERNKCVSLIARMALALGYRAGIGDHEGENWHSEWWHVIYVDLPVGQVSWHVPNSELSLFDFLPKYEGKWDSHTTEEKYERVVNPGI